MALFYSFWRFCKTNIDNAASISKQGAKKQKQEILTLHFVFDKTDEGHFQVEWRGKLWAEGSCR